MIPADRLAAMRKLAESASTCTIDATSAGVLALHVLALLSEVDKLRAVVEAARALEIAADLQVRSQWALSKGHIDAREGHARKKKAEAAISAIREALAALDGGVT